MVNEVPALLETIAEVLGLLATKPEAADPTKEMEAAPPALVDIKMAEAACKLCHSPSPQSWCN